ncbi:MAG: tRNA (adenosine(37)-N6)-dimethylallyltransferase MiaA [Chloroflexota bacterium]|jgi:tRNA dimethylallyltransferase
MPVDTQGGQVQKSPLLVLVGPTAIGKTAFSLKLGQKYGGEIVSADSRLFYKGMDIGTAKPTPTERSLVPHHLIDICQPDETITLGQYKRLAEATINAIQKRGNLPLLVGGTGQYIRAIVEGWGIPEVPPQGQLREVLKEIGQDELYRWLRYLDRESAGRIDPRNVRRVIRALEVTLITGRPMSLLQRKTPPDYNILMVGLTCDRGKLYERIDARVDRMMARGFLQEVIQLRKSGSDRSLPSMSGLGYRQIGAYLEGECTLEEAIERIKFETHRFVRQQYTWFRLDDEKIHWFDVLESGWQESAEDDIQEWLGTIGILPSGIVEPLTD